MALLDELKLFYDTIQFATCISDAQGNCLHINPKWQEVTGLSEHQSSGQGWSSNIHEEDVLYLKSIFPGFLASKKNGVFNYRITVNEDTRHIQKLSTPVLINNEIAYYICILNDQTAHMQQELQLKQQNELLNVLQQIQINFLKSDNESEIFESLLQQILALTGCEYGFIGEVLTEAENKKVMKAHAISTVEWHDETKQLYEKRSATGMRFENLDNLFGHAILSGEPVISNDFRHDPRKGGTPPGHPDFDSFLGIPVKCGDETIGIIGLSNKKGGFDQNHVSFLEPLTITVSTLLQAHNMRKQKLETEHRTLENAQYLQVLLASLDDIVLEMNEQFVFTNVWTTDESKLFVPREVFIGRSFKEFFDGPFYDTVMPILESVLNTGEPAMHEYEDIRPGEERWFSGKYNLVKLANGEKRILKQIRDITELKKSQMEMLRAKDEAEKAARIKSEFLSVMSHEIRTPMNAIIGFIDLLLHEDPKPEQISYLKNLKLSAAQLLYLLNNILDYSKLEAGKMQAEEVNTSLREQVHIIEKTFSQLATEKNITLTATIDDNIPEFCKTDPFRLNRILTNLVSNAIKFTESGNVSINLALVNDTGQNIRVRFKVADTGIGISPEQLPHVFDEFTQEHSSTTRKYGGTGLGLTITRKLVEEFGSSITVESKKSMGTTFSFELDLKKGKAEKTRAAEEKHTTADLSALNILIVEDNVINAMIVQKFIQNWGGKSMHAPSGPDAIEMVKSYTFDMILMDLQMPDMDGFETTSEVRKILPEIPIIALTADAMAETKTKVLASGMDNYMTKPFNPDDLRDLISLYRKQL
jgi:PAS domain S-box-containing protein